MRELAFLALLASLLGTPVLVIWSIVALFSNKRLALKLLGGLVVTAALCFGCGYECLPPSPAHLLTEFSAQVKQMADPLELQRWAKNQPKIANLESARDAVPEGLRHLISQRLEMEMVTFDQENEQPVVTLWWGGGFRHWGVTVGQPSYKEEPDELHLCSEWKPGIYFWVEL